MKDAYVRCTLSEKERENDVEPAIMEAKKAKKGGFHKAGVEAAEESIAKGNKETEALLAKENQEGQINEEPGYNRDWFGERS